MLRAGVAFATDRHEAPVPPTIANLAPTYSTSALVPASCVRHLYQSIRVDFNQLLNGHHTIFEQYLVVGN